MKSKRASELPSSSDGLPDLFVSRLERLVRLRCDFEEHLNDLGVQLLDRSIVATWRDCVETGAGDRAKVLIGRLPAGEGTWEL